MTRFWQWTTVALIGLVLGGGCLVQFTGLGASDEVFENRRLAAFPAWDGDLPKFVRRVDRWFQDNYRLRSLFIRATKYEQIVLLNSPVSRDVVAGQDGWLYFIGERIPQYVRNEIPYPPEQLARIRSLWAQRSEELDRRGIPYAILIAPNSNTLYPEFQPAWLRWKVHPESRLDELAAMARRDRALPFLDPRPRLLEYKREHPGQLIYMKNDTHWNDLGAYQAYALLMGKLAEELRSRGRARQAEGLAPIPLSEFKVERAVESAGLSDMMGMPDGFRAETYNLRHPLQAGIEVVQQGDRAAPGTLLTRNPRARTPLRALIFRDSFFVRMIPLVSLHFKEVQYLAYPPDFDWRAVDAFRPDVAVTEIVERRLMDYDPLAGRYVPE